MVYIINPEELEYLYLNYSNCSNKNLFKPGIEEVNDACFLNVYCIEVVFGSKHQP